MLIFRLISTLAIFTLIFPSIVLGKTLAFNTIKLDEQYRHLTLKAGYATGEKTPEEIVASIIQYLLSFLGVIFVVLMIYAGFLWMTARGDSDQVSTAKEIMTSAVIGIAIVLTSYIITTAILSNLDKAVSS